MILPFSTQMNGKPTYFVEKILKSIENRETTRQDEIMLTEGILEGYINIDMFDEVNPKLHTIREDKNDRWHVGTKIDFFINCRQPDMFRFAPVLPVVSTQKFEIKWFELFDKKMVRVFIDDKAFAWVKIDGMLVAGEMLQLAQNDGFDTIEDFFTYFNEDFKGKIIHWTDLRY